MSAARFKPGFADLLFAARLTLTLGSGPPAYLLPMRDDIDSSGRFRFFDWCLLAGSLGAMGLALALLQLVVAE